MAAITPTPVAAEVTEAVVVDDVLTSRAVCTTAYPAVELLVPDGIVCPWATLPSTDEAGINQAAQDHAKVYNHTVEIDHTRDITYGIKP